MRKDFKIGGRVGFNRGGSSAPFLRGRSGASNIKAPRGSEGWKQMQKAEAKLPKTKSDFRLKDQVKKIQKTPDKKFKYNNPETTKVKSDRTGKIHDVQKTNPVKGSRGKKKYIQDWKKGHQAHKRMGLIKD